MGDLTLGQYIRQERRNYMSLRSFAKEVGVSASYLSDVELDRRRISSQMAFRIARTFKRSIGGSGTERYNAMLHLAGLMTAERQCLIDLWNCNESLSTHTTLEIFDVLFLADNEGGDK
jgi:transcriptional regulator with XRE-family HTH domain